MAQRKKVMNGPEKLSGAMQQEYLLLMGMASTDLHSPLQGLHTVSVVP